MILINTHKAEKNKKCEIKSTKLTKLQKLFLAHYKLKASLGSTIKHGRFYVI